jgi:chromosome segregation ATPase
MAVDRLPDAGLRKLLALHYDRITANEACVQTRDGSERPDLDMWFRVDGLWQRLTSSQVQDLWQAHTRKTPKGKQPTQSFCNFISHELFKLSPQEYSEVKRGLSSVQSDQVTGIYKSKDDARAPYAMVLEFPSKRSESTTNWLLAGGSVAGALTAGALTAAGVVHSKKRARELTEAQQRNDSQSKELQSIKEQNTALNMAQSIVAGELATHQRTSEQLAQKLLDAETSLTQITDEHQETKSNLENQLSALTQQLQVIQAENSTLKTQQAASAQVKASNLALQTQAQKAADDLARVKASQAQLTQKAQDAEQQLARVKASQAQLAQKAQDAEQQLAQAKALNMALQTQLDQQGQQAQTSASLELAQAKASISRLQIERQTDAQDLARVRESQASSTAQLTQRATKAEQELSQANTSISKLQQRLQTQDQANARQQQDIERLTASNLQLSGDKEATVQEADRVPGLNALILEQIQSIQTNEAKLKALETSNSTLKASNQSIKDELVTVNTSLQGVRAKLQAIGTENQRLLASNSSLVKDLAKATESSNTKYLKANEQYAAAKQTWIESERVLAAKLQEANQQLSEVTASKQVLNDDNAQLNQRLVEVAAELQTTKDVLDVSERTQKTAHSELKRKNTQLTKDNRELAADVLKQRERLEASDLALNELSASTQNAIKLQQEAEAKEVAMRASLDRLTEENTELIETQNELGFAQRQLERDNEQLRTEIEPSVDLKSNIRYLQKSQHTARRALLKEGLRLDSVQNLAEEWRGYLTELRDAFSTNERERIRAHYLGILEDTLVNLKRTLDKDGWGQYDLRAAEVAASSLPKLTTLSPEEITQVLDKERPAKGPTLEPLTADQEKALIKRQARFLHPIAKPVEE